MGFRSEAPSSRSPEDALRKRERQISPRLRTAYKQARLQLVQTIEALERTKESKTKTAELVSLILKRTAARIAGRSAKGTSKPAPASTLPAALLEANGGAYTTPQVATLLGISRQAVFARRQQDQLLGVQLPSRRELLYPKWQFTAEGGVVEGLDEVLRALGDAPAWAKFRFFTSGNYRLKKRRPIELLRADGATARDRVVWAAASFGEHGAA